MTNHMNLSRTNVYGAVVAARRAMVMCVFSHFCVDFQSSVLASLTLACASCRGQCDGMFCFAIFCRVFDLLPSEDSLFVEVGGDL